MYARQRQHKKLLNRPLSKEWDNEEVVDQNTLFLLFSELLNLISENSPKGVFAKLQNMGRQNLLVPYYNLMMIFYG